MISSFAQEEEEEVELQTQHTVQIRPNFYQFQSIGTNALPPEIQGVFEVRAKRGPFPTAIPQRLTQGKTDQKYDQAYPNQFVSTHIQGAYINYVDK